ncbi:Gx transporter family protein, partial [Eubacteriales bacterium OttesenSCG-928-K08]|nr:Gx transporter family protein [Eubacteriales bacterium OttesenSCG-928-K08]
MNARKIAQFGMLTAVALVLGYFERFIPMPTLPGVKLGLANTVLLYAIYIMDAKSAALLMALKVLLSGLMFAGLSGIIYSFAGGVVSLGLMLAAKKIPGLGIIPVSMIGALGHNIGQLIAAGLAVGFRPVLVYFPFLMAAALATGLLTGVIAKYSLRALKLYTP